MRYDPAAKTCALTLVQSCPPTPQQADKKPFHIPVAIGLLDDTGHDVALHLDGVKDAVQGATTRVLELTEPSHTFVFTNVHEQPVPSLLRGFSAPVALEYAYTDADLAFLMAHDSDPFNRWEAGQRLAMRRLLALAEAVKHQAAITGAGAGADDPALAAALRATLNNNALDPAFRELVLALPSEALIAEQMDAIDPQAIHTARLALRRSLAERLRADLQSAYESNRTDGAYSPDAAASGRRALKNMALSYLSEFDDAQSHALAQAQYGSAGNMTDRLAALTALVNGSTLSKVKAKALAHIYDEFRAEPLVVDKWFALQATARGADVAAIRKLAQHPAFTLKNPNRARSLIFSFCNANPSAFHAVDGSGYALWAEYVIAFNAVNPQVAARLARSLDRWRKYAPALQKKMRAALQQVAAAPKLSKDVLEVVTKALAA
jgi:aminopeptidase N